MTVAMPAPPSAEGLPMRRPMIGVDTLRKHLGGASLATLNRWVKSGAIPPPVKIGQTRLWPAGVLDDIEAGRIGGAGEADDV